jgi:hypothetical protein
MPLAIEKTILVKIDGSTPPTIVALMAERVGFGT